MENMIILNLTEKEIKLVIACLLITKETFKCVPLKTNDIKMKITEIEELLKKIQ